MRRSLKISSSVLALSIALSLTAACGDSDSSDTSASSTSSVAGGVPAITANATDLKKEPIIGVGGATPPAGLVIADLVTGEGKAAVATDTVDVQYTGALYSNGTVFDGTWQRGGQPTSFSLAEVVPGFTQGITGMKPGGRREIVIPPALGYGDQATGGIPAGSTLVFVVDLVGIS